MVGLSNLFAPASSLQAPDGVLRAGEVAQGDGLSCGAANVAQGAMWI